MEQFSFHYSSYIRKVSKIGYFRGIKNRIRLTFISLFLLLSISVLAATQSLLLGIVSIAVLLITLIEIVNRIYFAPMKLSKDQRYNKDFMVCFDSNEISLASDEISSKVAYDFFTGVWENHEFYLLFHNKKQFWFLPKKEFRDQNQEQTFRGYITKYHKISSGVIR